MLAKIAINCCVFFVLFGFTKQVKSQCALTIFPSYEYDCTTGLAVVGYTIGGTGGLAPYTCTFVNASNNTTVATGSTSSNTGTVINLPVGIYNVYLSSSNGCTLSSIGFNITFVYSAANSSFNTGSVSCFGGSNGSAFVTPPSSFSPPYTFTWLPTNSNAQSNGTLSAGIIYTCTVVDLKGCSVSNTVSVIGPQEINSGVSNLYVPCFGGTLQTVATSSGGIAPYTYSLNGVATSSNMLVTAGTQTITAKDANSCLKTTTIQVSQAPQVTFSFNATSPTCPGKSDGSLLVNVSNAPLPLSFSWQPGGSSSSLITNIPVGNYTLTVTDASLCVTKSVTAVVPASSITSNASTQSENCSAADGGFTLNVTGGTPPYTYTTYPIAINNSVTGNISSGSYTTIIADFNNCLDTLKFFVGNLSTVSLNIVNTNSISCYNTCNGAVNLSVQNGVAPYTYSASGQPTTSSSFINGLCPGFYVIKVLDAIGCPASTTLNFPNPPFFSYSVATPAPICYGKQTNLVAGVSGGSPGYLYVWNPGNLSGQQVAVSPTSTTVYSLSVFDSKACTLAPYQVTVAVNPQIAIMVNASGNGICPGGTAQITPTVTGGDGNYTYLWLPGNSVESSVYIESVQVPSYTFVVNDQCGSPTASQVIPIKLFEVATPSFTAQNQKGCEPFCTRFLNTTPQSSMAIWNFGDSPNEVGADTGKYCYKKAGNYNVRLTVIDINSCKSTTTYPSLVQVIAPPRVDFTTEAQTLPLSEANNVLFENTSNGASAFQWFVNDHETGTESTMSYSFPDTGCYSVKLLVKNSESCVDSTQKLLCVVEDFQFFMPNVFTPNNDKLNDTLLPQGTGWSNQGYLFEIYNQWGNLLFITEDPRSGWNGNYRENNANATKPKADKEDAYVWRVQISDKLGQKHRLNGSVIILR